MTYIIILIALVILVIAIYIMMSVTGLLTFFGDCEHCSKRFCIGRLTERLSGNFNEEEYIKWKKK